MLQSLGGFPSYAAALAFGYLCGSIPFGLILTRLAGTQDIRSHRLRQYRRDQCAAHRPQGARRRDAARRRAQGHARGAGVAQLLRAASLRCSPRSARSSATCFRSGSDFKGGKGVATYIGVLLGARLAGGARLLPDLARGRGAHALFLARRAVASAATPFCSGFSASTPKRLLFALLTAAALDHAPRQHRAALATAPKARSARQSNRPRSSRCPEAASENDARLTLEHGDESF